FAPSSRSGLDEGQQISVDGVGMSGRHAVRESRVSLQRAVLYQLDRAWARGGAGHDLIGLTVIARTGTLTFLRSSE
ncbi:MAG TPA: hypothetical protein VGH31_03330, partial [Acidimicrobiales bacterium]